MALQSKLEFPGDGVTTQWTLNFASGYLNQSDVTCYVVGEGQDRTIDWISETLVEISGATPAVGETVVFQRITPNDVPINQFSGGDAFSSDAIDTSIKQLLLSTQEGADRVEEILSTESDRIKTLYEENDDTNAFTDAAAAKLTGIEAGATADMTGAEIKASYESQNDTNAFTDAAAAKLTGIEAGATADMTGAEIKASYESQSDTNAFTDADVSKLAGIEAGATANVIDAASVAAAGAVMDSELTNEAAVKGINQQLTTSSSPIFGGLAVQGVTVGRGSGDVSTNTATGGSALFSNTTGSSTTAIGYSALYYNTTGDNNTAVGYSALNKNTTGDNNSATGWKALFSNTIGHSNTAAGFEALTDNITGSRNTATGYRALANNTDGGDNTATGLAALFNNTTGATNSAHGYQALYSNTTGDGNTAEGYRALASNTTGFNNVAVGFDGLESNTTGSRNTAHGYRALAKNTTGDNNTAIGNAALYLNTIGVDNVASGHQALYNNTEGSANAALGKNTLFQNTTGADNAAVGRSALFKNTTGSENTASGRSAMFSNTTGNYNSAFGYQALFSNTTGFNNTAAGYEALYENTTGTRNTAGGRSALYSNTEGSENAAFGQQALNSNTTGSYNTAVGKSAGAAIVSGDYNTVVGHGAEVINPTADNQIAIRAGETEWLAGTGSPVGAVSSGVGSLYASTSTGALFVKESATGSDGWMQVARGDTYAHLRTNKAMSGLSVDYNGAAPSYPIGVGDDGRSWLSRIGNNVSGGATLSWLETHGNDVTTVNDGIAVVGASRAVGQIGVGGSFIGVSDTPDSTPANRHAAWGLYVEGQRYNQCGMTKGIEANCVNNGTDTLFDISPYNRPSVSSNAAVGVSIANGADGLLHPDSENSSCAVLINNNSSTDGGASYESYFERGIVFTGIAIEQKTHGAGTLDASPAIHMPANNAIVWDTPTQEHATEILASAAGTVVLNRVGTGSPYMLDFRNGNVTRGSIQISGSSTSYNTTSDARLKKDVIDAGDAGATIDAIRVVSYDWKDTDEHTSFGVIAQELHEVCPEAVSEGSDGDGVPEGVADVWAVDHSKLVPMLIKEIQDLRARVQSLET